MIKVISRELIDQTISNAQSFERRRSIYRFHENDEEKIQRMLNAIEPDSYICPHKHENPDKIEVFIVLQGKLLALRFNDLGEVAEHQVFSPGWEVVGVEFAPKEWHAVWALEAGSVVYEIIEGPYSPQTHKDFAAWAPSEENREAAIEYMQKVKGSLGL